MGLTTSIRQKPPNTFIIHNMLFSSIVSRECPRVVEVLKLGGTVMLVLVLVVMMMTMMTMMV